MPVAPFADVAAYWPLESSAGEDTVGALDLTLSSSSAVTFPASKKNNGFRHTANAYRTFTRAIGSAGLLATPETGFSFSAWSFIIPQVTQTNPAIAALGNSFPSSLDWGWFLIRECNLGGSIRRTKVFTQSSGGTVDSITNTVDIGGGDGVWFHYLVTRAAGASARLRLYVNGTVVEGTSTGCKTPASAPFTIGAAFVTHADIAAGASTPLRGGIDECGYWTRELSSDEAAWLYNAGSGFFYPPGGVRMAAGSSYQPGAVAGSHFLPGAAAGSSYLPGAVAGQGSIP